MRHLFMQPFPRSLQYFRSSTIAAGIVFFIIYFLRPFGLDQVPEKNILSHAFLYGAITFIATAANIVLLPKLFPQWLQETHWTTGKELLMMLWQVITISLANGLLSNILYGYNLSFNTFFTFLGYTSAVGIFPIVFIVLVKHITLLKKYQQAALSIQPELIDAQSEKKQQNSIITLLGDYQNEVLELSCNDILFLSTADNYIQVFYLKDGTVVSAFLRNTLKKAEESLGGFPQFFRCHRTYLVNLNKVEYISGNAQGLKLHIKGCSESIPVSRSLNQQLRQQIKTQSSTKGL